MCRLWRAGLACLVCLFQVIVHTLQRAFVHSYSWCLLIRPQVQSTSIEQLQLISECACASMRLQIVRLLLQVRGHHGPVTAPCWPLWPKVVIWIASIWKHNFRTLGQQWISLTWLHSQSQSGRCVKGYSARPCDLGSLMQFIYKIKVHQSLESGLNKTVQNRLPWPEQPSLNYFGCWSCNMKSYNKFIRQSNSSLAALAVSSGQSCAQHSCLLLPMLIECWYFTQQLMGLEA